MISVFFAIASIACAAPPRPALRPTKPTPRNEPAPTKQLEPPAQRNKLDYDTRTKKTSDLDRAFEEQSRSKANEERGLVVDRDDLNFVNLIKRSRIVAPNATIANVLAKAAQDANPAILRKAIVYAREQGEPFLARLYELDPVTRETIMRWSANLTANPKGVEKLIASLPQENIFFGSQGLNIHVIADLGDGWKAIGRLGGDGEFLIRDITNIGKDKPPPLTKITQTTTPQRLVFIEQEAAALRTRFPNDPRRAEIETLIRHGLLENPDHDLIVSMLWGLDGKPPATPKLIAEASKALMSPGPDGSAPIFARTYEESGIRWIQSKATKMADTYKIKARESGYDDLYGFIRAVRFAKSGKILRLDDLGAKAKAVLERKYAENSEGYTLLRKIADEGMIGKELTEADMRRLFPEKTGVSEQQSVRWFIRQLDERLVAVEGEARRLYGSDGLEAVQMTLGLTASKADAIIPLLRENKITSPLEHEAIADIFARDLLTRKEEARIQNKYGLGAGGAARIKRTVEKSIMMIDERTRKLGDMDAFNAEVKRLVDEAKNDRKNETARAIVRSQLNDFTEIQRTRIDAIYKIYNSDQYYDFDSMQNILAKVASERNEPLSTIKSTYQKIKAALDGH